MRVWKVLFKCYNFFLETSPIKVQKRKSITGGLITWWFWDSCCESWKKMSYVLCFGILVVSLGKKCHMYYEGRKWWLFPSLGCDEFNEFGMLGVCLGITLTSKYINCLIFLVYAIWHDHGSLKACLGLHLITKSKFDKVLYH